MAYNEESSNETFRNFLIKKAKVPNKDFHELIEDIKKACEERAQNQEYEVWFNPKNSIQKRIMKTANFERYIQNELELDFQIHETHDNEVSICLGWIERTVNNKRKVNS